MTLTVLPPILLLLLLTTSIRAIHSSPPPFGPYVNLTRLQQTLSQLSSHNDLVAPAAQRILYTASDVSARNYLRTLFRTLSLTVHEDAIGNIFATWPGTSPSLPPILTGSHYDAIPNSGIYDGTLGVLSAVEAVRVLQESGFKPLQSITIVAFTSEEPTRFGVSCLGSRILSRCMPLHHLNTLTDGAGVSFHAARKAAGYTATDLSTVPFGRTTAPYSRFIELHIEQADVLQRTNTAIGIVTAIAAPAMLRIRLSGRGGHAGALRMQLRNDAATAAAELVLAVESAANNATSEYAVATTGKIDVFPNAINSVPSNVTLHIDVRDADERSRDGMLATIKAAAEHIAARRGVMLSYSELSRDTPARCDDGLMDMVAHSARMERLSTRRMVSRAYHDALFMAHVMPMAMIFVPCRDGVSHTPREFVTDEDMRNGVAVLAGVLKMAADGSDGGGEQAGKDEL